LSTRITKSMTSARTVGLSGVFGVTASLLVHIDGRTVKAISKGRKWLHEFAEACQETQAYHRYCAKSILHMIRKTWLYASKTMGPNVIMTWTFRHPHLTVSRSVSQPTCIAQMASHSLPTVNILIYLLYLNGVLKATSAKASRVYIRYQ
jgi:hypothetical protein